MGDYLSLDIGFSQIKLVVGNVLGSKINVKKALVFDTPENTIEDGRILDVEALAEAVKTKLLARRIKTKDAIITINSTAIISREVVMPKAKENEIKSIIDMESEQYFPVNLDSYKVDFKVIEEITVDKSTQYKILVVAIPASIIERYIELIEACGLTPIKLDFLGNSFSKIISNELFRDAKSKGVSFGFKDKSLKGISSKNMTKKDKLIEDQSNSNKSEENSTMSEARINRSVVLLDIGAKTTSVTIVSNGVLQFSRIIMYGGVQMTNAIADRLQLSFDEAEGVKKALERLVTTGEEELEDERSLDISTAIKSVALILIDDVLKYLEFYKSRATGNHIDQIYIAGGTSHINGLEIYLRDSLGVPVMKWDSMKSVRVAGAKSKEEIDLKYYVGCIGALLGRRMV